MKRIFIRAIAGLGIGLGFGILQLVIMGFMEYYYHDHTVNPLRFYSWIFNILNAPADWFSRIWIEVLHMPPRSGFAWVIVPLMTILLQWGAIGFLAGICWGMGWVGKGGRKRNYESRVSRRWS